MARCWKRYFIFWDNSGIIIGVSRARLFCVLRFTVVWMKLLPASASPALRRIRAKNDFTHFTRQQKHENDEQISDDDAGLPVEWWWWWWCLDDVVFVVVVVVVVEDDVVALTHSPTPDGGARLNIACMQWHTMLWNSSTSGCALIQRHIRLWGKKNYWRTEKALGNEPIIFREIVDGNTT